MTRSTAAASLLAATLAATLPAACAHRPSQPPETTAVDVNDDDALRRALLDLKERDQAARTRLVEAMKSAESQPGGGFTLTGENAGIIRAVQAVDAESTAFLKRMVADRGWPTRSQVGDDGAHAAWLLAQHADKDPDFQAEVLALMEPLVARGEAEPRLFALLTDRVRLARGDKQLYATQFTTDDQGVMRPRPTEDWDGIDERRAAVGLSPIAEYARSLSESYGEPADPTPVE